KTRQAFQTPGVPPTRGSSRFPTCGSTRNKSVAPTKSVAAYRPGSNATSKTAGEPPPSILQLGGKSTLSVQIRMGKGCPAGKGPKNGRPANSYNSPMANDVKPLTLNHERYGLK